jgi:bilirubin oxidase
MKSAPISQYIHQVIKKSPLKHLLANLLRRTIEIWRPENKSGGRNHPVHMYHVGLEVLQRIGRGVEPLEATEIKDVIWLGKNEEMLVKAHYAFLNVVFVFHYHGLIHEDHDMMAALEPGYNEETYFSHPEDPRWSAVAFGQADWTRVSGSFIKQAIAARLRDIATQQPYSEQAQVEVALAAVWAGTSAQKRSVDDGH